ncbi:helix-turn-helix domain-containing protein [Nocardia sp. NPDC046763]|uniref:helix-turn-helix domain-containing protein n=1 Tax=Nocardia sp. NPDC046763 TaxID=3155256 RepID=UPI0033FBCFC7
MVVCADGEYKSIALADFIERARGLSAPPLQDEDPALTLKQLTKDERRQLTERAGHIREVLTGYRSGYAQAGVDGEPQPAYSPTLSLGARCRAKAEELSVSERTIKRWLAAYRDSGEAGLADLRHRRHRGEQVDARWVAAVRAELEASVTASTPTRSAVFLRVRQRLDAAFGPGVVASPSRATEYRWLEELAKPGSTDRVCRLSARLRRADNRFFKREVAAGLPSFSTVVPGRRSEEGCSGDRDGGGPPESLPGSGPGPVGG